MLYRGTFNRAARWLTLISAFAATAFAQTPPPEVDKALRARVNEFFQCHVDGNFRKAYELVAEDTKDYYFAALKVRLKSFSITGIKYSDDFTKAAVDLNSDQEIRRPEFPGTVVPIPMTTMWKVEEGKWVWYRDAANTHVTPMGDSDISKIMPGAKISAEDLPKVVTPEQIQRMAASILHQAGIDKPEVTLATDKPSSAVVTFHNGQSGTVKVTIAGGKSLAGFTSALDKMDVGPNEDAVLKLTYDPQAGGTPPPKATLRLVVEPFDQIFDVAIKFVASSGANR
jgi:hypothetical protein